MAATVALNEQLRRFVETHHIDRIPEAARHGKPWHQFAFWWGGNVNVFNVVLGAVVVSFGLSFWWALTAITVGTLIGALLIALHATRGRCWGCHRRSSPAPSSASTAQRSFSPASC
jgi:purine-cytosine permease-like protein